MDKTTERQYSLASSHNAKSRRLTLHTARMVTRHQNRRYFGPPNHVGHHRDTTLLRQWLPRPRMAFIGNQTARYSLHQPVRCLLLSLHVDRHKLCKIHHITPDIQREANSYPIARRLHRIRLRRSLETACKRLLCMSRIIFSSWGPELRGTKSLILSPDQQSEHTISGPR